jgi:hypothetical protein
LWRYGGGGALLVAGRSASPPRNPDDFSPHLPLARILHTPMETPTLRRVRARGLQARITAPVGRVPSRGAQGCEIYPG